MWCLHQLQNLTFQKHGWMSNSDVRLWELVVKWFEYQYIPFSDQRRSVWRPPSCCHPSPWRWHAGDPPHSPRPRSSWHRYAFRKEGWGFTWYITIIHCGIFCTVQYSIVFIDYWYGSVFWVHTRFLLHRASHGPYQHPAAGGRRACQTRNGQR